MADEPAAAGAPAPAPSTPPASVPVSGGLADATPGDKSFSLSDDVMFDSNLDEVEIPAEAPSQTPQQSQAQPSEGEAPKPGEAKPLATPAKPQEAQPPPAQPAQPAAVAPQGAQPAPSQGVAPDLLSALAQHKDAIIGELASKRFALTPAETQALETDAIGTIPKLLARAYYESATTTINQINNMVPRLIEHVVGQLRTTNEAEDAFFRAWPQLDRTNHAQQVNLAANYFRQANPSASRDEAIQAVGKMVSAMVGLPIQAPAANPAAPAPAARSRPFSPASGGGRVVSTTPVDPGVQFAGMGMEFDS